MGLLKNIGRKIVNGVKNAAVHVIKEAAYVAVKVTEFTVDIVAEVVQSTAAVIERGARKLNEWGSKLNELGNKIIPKDPVPPQVISIYDPQIIEGTKNAIKETYPDGTFELATNGDPSTRVKKMEEYMQRMTGVLGVEPKPELVTLTPDNPEDTWRWLGSYNYEDNVLRLNLPMIVCDNPEAYREQCSTICHELVHARQRLAVQAWADGKSFEQFGYSEEYVIKLAENFVHYIRPEENYEAYTKQPIEAEAYWFEQQIKQYLV